MTVIGITGTIGAGKGTVTKYLTDNYGFKSYSVRDFLIEEINRRGLAVNRDSMVDVANDLRATHGPGYIVSELYKRAQQNSGNTIIESVRTIGEVETLKNKPNFSLLAIDADIKQRYERIKNRESSTDSISFEKFVEDEQRELTSNDPGKQNLLGCIKLADYVILNNKGLPELKTQVDSIINTLQNP
ncbi:MAG: AAA family ATPase [Candidatus Doudnabacteria bacterium]|nr:AAA family ATPase [Candidatus Doudnabacteria bacterium]